jgi:photosystem II stability/assembly factor-like uncharacterized protein
MPSFFPVRAASCAVAATLLLTNPLPAQWTSHESGTKASLRGLSVVDAKTAWASGARGTVTHTIDGGTTWRADTIPGASAFDIRAIHARNARVAHAAATAGRIWRTTDGGRSWSLQYQARDTSVFLDAIDFWDDRNGIAIGDPIGGRFFILVTDDGGGSWHEAPPASRPMAEPGEAAFAASGTSFLAVRRTEGYIGSGGSVARVHSTSDRGGSWTVASTPMLQGTPSRGIFSIAVPTKGSMILVGGDYSQPDTVRGNAAYSGDGRTFTLRASSSPRGFRSGVAIFSRGDRPAVAIAVGPTGSDITHDHGGHWVPFDSVGYHAVRASRDGMFYAAGSDGRVATFDARSLK